MEGVRGVGVAHEMLWVDAVIDSLGSRSFRVQAKLYIRLVIG